MSGNSIGKNFVVTTFGESHGVALGCIVDGCPPGMALEAGDIINSGTPAGVALGDPDPQYLRPGDKLTVEIAGLGRQDQVVTARA